MTDKKDYEELAAWAEEMADEFEAGIVATPGEPVPPLIEISRMRYERRRIEDETRRLVRVAREAGESWHRIGLALGITAEGARQRYREAS